MGYLLRFDGVNDRVDIPEITLASSFEIEIDLTYYSASGVRFFFSGWTPTNAGRWYVGTSGNTLFWLLSSGFVGNTNFTLTNSTRYKIKLIRAGNNFTLQVNGSTVATRTQAFSMQNFSRIGASQDPLYFAFMDFYTLTYSDGVSPSNSQTWNASLSGGTGTTLPTVSGTNQGTLVNFTVPACWIFYDDGGAGAVELEASLTASSTLTASLTTAIPLAATLSGLATCSASLTTQIRLQASLSANTSLTANLRAGTTPLAATLQALTALNANLSGGSPEGVNVQPLPAFTWHFANARGLIANKGVTPYRGRRTKKGAPVT